MSRQIIRSFFKVPVKIVILLKHSPFFKSTTTDLLSNITLLYYLLYKYAHFGEEKNLFCGFLKPDFVRKG